MNALSIHKFRLESDKSWTSVSNTVKSHVCCHNQEKILNFDDLFLPQPPVVASAAAVINSLMYIYLSATECIDLKQINCFTRRPCDVTMNSIQATV